MKVLAYAVFCLLFILTISLALNIPKAPGPRFLPAGSTSQSIAPQLNTPSQSVTPLQALNVTDYLSPSTLGVGAELRCDPLRFGHPNAESCREALFQIPLILSNPVYSFGPRGEGDFDIGLPRRYISC